MLTYTMTSRIVGTSAVVVSLALSGCGGGGGGSTMSSIGSGTGGGTMTGDPGTGGGTGTMPPDPAILAEPAALANAIDLVTNDERVADGEYIGSWRLVSDNREGGTYSAINKTHGGGEYVYAAVLWHDENGELQYGITIVQNDDDFNEPLSRDPWVAGSRYIDTGEDPQNREGFTTFRQSVSDHGLGTVWQATELTHDYDNAGAVKVFIATDLTEADMAGDPYVGEREVAIGGKIELQGIPLLPADRDYLSVWVADGDSLAGSVDGVAGEFSCANSDGCGFYSVHRTASGYFTVADDLFFTPDGGTIQAVPPEVLNAEAATDYLAFGYWLYVPEDVTQTDAYEFGVFGSGGEPFETANIAGLTGTATYAGDAAGLYYVNRSSQSPSTGSFTADVGLTADFGTISEWGTVSGEVSNFSFEGNVAAMFPATWELQTRIGSSYRDKYGIQHGERNIFEGSASSSNVNAGGLISSYTWVEDYNGESWYGNWDAKFFGNGANATDTPNSIAGTFNARQYYDTGTQDVDASNGAEIGLSGSFGAHKQP